MTLVCHDEMYCYSIHCLDCPHAVSNLQMNRTSDHRHIKQAMVEPATKQTVNYEVPLYFCLLLPYIIIAVS